MEYISRANIEEKVKELKIEEMKKEIDYFVSHYTDEDLIDYLEEKTWILYKITHISGLELF